MSTSDFPILELQTQLKRKLDVNSFIFDPVRKKWILENPEEIVRQSLILWLQLHQLIPFSRMAVEKQIQIHGMSKRFDLVVYDKQAKPFILIECKSPQLRLHQKFFDQVAVYNMNLQAPYLGICNGLELKFCKIDFEKRIYQFTDTIPLYPF